MGIIPIDIKYLESKAANIYEAIVIASKRARQINEEVKIEFNQRVETIRGPISETTEEGAEPESNPDQIEIAREFERRQKPTQIALSELLNDKLDYRYKDEAQS